MVKKYLPLLPLLVLALVVSNVVSAVSLSLTKIGALSTGGSMYNEWWYTGQNPVLTGTAGESSEVSIVINSESNTVSADGSGNWSFAPSNMPTGDHTVAISSGGESYNFTLHTGQGLPADFGTTQTTQGTSPVPATGSDQIIVFLIASGLLAFGGYLLITSNPKKLFEKNAIRDVE